MQVYSQSPRSGLYLDPNANKVANILATRTGAEESTYAGNTNVTQEPQALTGHANWYQKLSVAYSKVKPGIEQALTFAMLVKALRPVFTSLAALLDDDRMSVSDVVKIMRQRKMPRMFRDESVVAGALNLLKAEQYANNAKSLTAKQKAQEHEDNRIAQAFTVCRQMGIHLPKSYPRFFVPASVALLPDFPAPSTAKIDTTLQTAGSAAGAVISLAVPVVGFVVSSMISSQATGHVTSFVAFWDRWFGIHSKPPGIGPDPKMTYIQRYLDGLDFRLTNARHYAGRLSDRKHHMWQQMLSDLKTIQFITGMDMTVNSIKVLRTMMDIGVASRDVINLIEGRQTNELEAILDAARSGVTLRFDRKRKMRPKKQKKKKLTGSESFTGSRLITNTDVPNSITGPEVGALGIVEAGADPSLEEYEGLDPEIVDEGSDTADLLAGLDDVANLFATFESEDPYELVGLYDNREYDRKSTCALCDDSQSNVITGDFWSHPTGATGVIYSSPLVTAQFKALDHGVHGMTILDSTPFQVYVSPDTSSGRGRIALIHEMIHIMDKLYKLNLTHDQIVAMAVFTTQELLPAIAGFDRKLNQTN